MAAWIAASPAGVAVASGPADDRVDLGRQIYGQYCAACHGAGGEGQPDWREPNAEGELPAPPHGPEGHTWRHSDEALYHMIAKGWRDPFNETDRLTMPAFEEVLAPKEIKAVVEYLKTLWTDEQRAFQAEESKGNPYPSMDD